MLMDFGTIESDFKVGKKFIDWRGKVRARDIALTLGPELA